MNISHAGTGSEVFYLTYTAMYIRQMRAVQSSSKSYKKLFSKAFDPKKRSGIFNTKGISGNSVKQYDWRKLCLP